MLTSKLTWAQIKKAHDHYVFQKRLDRAFIALSPKKVDAARDFFIKLKNLWDKEDRVVIAWLTKHVEPAIKDAFEYFLAKLNV